MVFIFSICIQYHGRAPAAAPSTGNKKQHERELHDFIVSIFGELTEAEKEVLRKEQEARIAQSKAEAEQRAKAVAAKKQEAEAASKQKPVITKPEPTKSGTPLAKPTDKK